MNIPGNILHGEKGIKKINMDDTFQLKEYLGIIEEYNYVADLTSGHNDLEYYSQENVIKIIGEFYVYLFKPIDLKTLGKCTKFLFELQIESIS